MTRGVVSVGLLIALALACGCGRGDGGSSARPPGRVYVVSASWTGALAHAATGTDREWIDPAGRRARVEVGHVVTVSTPTVQESTFLTQSRATTSASVGRSVPHDAPAIPMLRSYLGLDRAPPFAVRTTRQGGKVVLSAA